MTGDKLLSDVVKAISKSDIDLAKSIFYTIFFNIDQNIEVSLSNVIEKMPQFKNQPMI